MIVYGVFTLALWLGAYLLARPGGKSALRLAGGGFAAYALAIAFDHAQRGALSIACIGVSVICWAAAVGIELRRQRRAGARWPRALLIAAAIFFALSVGALVLSLGAVPRQWMLYGIGVDVALLGLAIARLDAFDEGERLWPDLARSGLGALLATGLFGGLLWWAAGPGPALFVMLAAAIGTQTLGNQLQALLDRLAFARHPALQQAREELRATEAALPRMPAVFDPAGMDDAEFVRITRRALSHYGDLAKLTASPLTHLSAVQQRLERAGSADTPLARATLLKQLLGECIAQLKPAGAAGFGSSDEWRHYNVLHWPYVAGLKPYAVREALRGEQDALSTDARAALEWFRSAVPERTLYNWQSAAARLVAQQLKG